VDLSRRTILTGAPVLGAAVALPAEALGAPGGGAAAVADGLRARWAEGARAFLEGVVGQEPAAAPAELRVIGDGVAALDVYKELEQLPATTQAQRPVQRLMRDLLRVIGESSLQTTAVVEAWLAPGGDAGDPDGRHMRGVLGALRIGMRGAKTRASRRELVERTLADALDDPDPGRLRASARRAARRTRKAEALAERLARDPAACARALALGPERAAALGLGPEPMGLVDDNAEWDEDGARWGDLVGVEVLAMLALGVLMWGGIFVAVYGFCGAVCGGSGTGILIFLIAAAAVVLGVLGRRALRRHGAARAAAEAAADAHTCPPCPPCPPPAAPLTDPAGPQGALPAPPQPLGWVSVPADAGWVAAPSAGPGHDQVVVAWGLVQTGRAWPADADGDGVAAGPGAPLPGAPAGALVGRVGDRTFFLGSEGVVPRGLVGPLLLALNLSPGAAARARGGVEVQVLARAVEEDAA
jgi:hypothetical protein